MTIKIPYWAHQLTDEGLLTFAAFTTRVCDKYGYCEWYSLNKEDLATICNKRGAGIIDWLRRELDGEAIEFADMTDHYVCFRVNKQPCGGSSKDFEHAQLTEDRQQKVWIYLLGCMNYNFLTDDVVQTNTYRPNTYHVTEFKITREALGYIKKQDRV